MDLAHLRVFRAVAECESYSRAAEQLGTSQPYVYVQIRDLQKQLGSALFTQVGKRALLTDAGRTLLAYANQMLQLEEDAAWSVRMSKGLHREQLTVVAGIVVTNYLLPEVVAAFRERLPNIDLRLDTFLPGTALTERFMRFETDLAFSAVASYMRHAIAEEVWRMEIVPCVGASHRLAEAAFVSANDFSKEEFIWIGYATITRRVGETVLRKLGIRPRSALVLTTPEAVKQVVMANYGVALIPRPVIAEEIAAGRIRPLTIPGFAASFPIYSMRHRSRDLSPAAAIFLQMASESAFKGPRTSGSA
jgi:DNA-binding transcriptional LysR family regulator